MKDLLSKSGAVNVQKELLNCICESFWTNDDYFRLVLNIGLYLFLNFNGNYRWLCVAVVMDWVEMDFDVIIDLGCFNVFLVNAPRWKYHLHNHKDMVYVCQCKYSDFSF